MAAKESDSDAIKKQELDDIATCCICTEVYTDPRALPCIHSVCMKCLQETGLKTNKGPGDEMPCPICRRLFKIPSEGFCGLPKHFLIQNLIQVTNVSDQSAVPIAVCDACLDENKEKAGMYIPAAETYCVDCNQKFCEECCREHLKLKLKKHHRLIPITEEESGQNVITDLATSVCELHEQKVLDVYCADCKTVVSSICFIDDHKNHDGFRVNKFVDVFLKQIKSNVEAINERRSKFELKKAELLKVKEDIQGMVGTLECAIDNRKDELKQLTDKQATSLLQGLCSTRQSKLKELQLTTDDIDEYLSLLENYISYCENIMAKGSASDICRAFSDLSVRAVELKEQCQPMIEREIQSFNLCFRKSEVVEILEESCENWIGEIEEEGDLKSKKRGKQSLLGEQSNEIDLLRQENTEVKQELEAAKTDCENKILNLEEKLNQEKCEKEQLIIVQAEEKRRLHDSENKILNLEEKLKEEKGVLEQLMIVQTDEKRKLNDYWCRSHWIIGAVLSGLLLLFFLDYSYRPDGIICVDSIWRSLGINVEYKDKNKMQQLGKDYDDEKRAWEAEKDRLLKMQEEHEHQKRVWAEETDCQLKMQKEHEDQKRVWAEETDRLQKMQKEHEDQKRVWAEETDRLLKMQKEHEDQKKAWAEEKDRLLKTQKELETKVNLDKLRYSSDPVLVQTIKTKDAEEEKKPIFGLTILDKELFVVSGGSSEVEVYDTIKLSFSRRWNLKELISPRDIASCNRNKCLYIMDCKAYCQSSEILRVDPNGNLIKKWSTGGGFGRLSVTGESNVILTSFTKNKLNEYTPDGQLIREINLLDEGIRDPTHAVKLSNGNFVVSHGNNDNDLNRVCLVDGDGKLKKSFGGIRGSTIEQMNEPFHLSVDGNGFVMVADHWNRRVLLLDQDLKFKREILSKEEHKLRCPWTILLDESNDRVFVSENQCDTEKQILADGHILIFDLK